MMFTLDQKQHIAAEIQKLLRSTGDPKLPRGEITFTLSLQAADCQSFGSIQNNGNFVVEYSGSWDSR